MRNICSQFRPDMCQNVVGTKYFISNIVVEVNSVNVFSEAQKAPLYMKLDSQFQTWWKSLGR